MRQTFRPVILRFDSLPSTNTEAARQASAGAAEGLCVVAREQTAGRGRRERAWVSPRDAGLYFSVVLRPRLEPAAWSLITLTAAVAVRDALVEACSLPTDIKWSNDLLARGRKVCGILAEAIETPRGRACVLGVGINLTESAFPPEISGRATSVEAETGARPDRDALLAALVRQLARRYEGLHEPGGAEAAVRAWSAASTYAEGKRVRVTLGDGEAIEGTTRGLEPDGALRVETTNADIKIVRAGDVTALRQMTDEDSADSC
ncbi:MAG TPA: biotin--[acetyl-CoA-carboxylase] ligase [Pyrinomonadaceae bacterium]|jgi:BirA family biotin operon repressor/biotin-[acetyl-CoA-carboxylase] ligase|nr:biotin--[acetyl-CoA-carboxylase] ligase [Pyrinomonadaceae bacterium]